MPDRSICILSGSIWKAAESLDSSTVKSENMSKPLINFLWSLSSEGARLKHRRRAWHAEP